MLAPELGVDLEALRDDALQLRGLLDPQSDRRDRARPRHHFVQHETQGPDIGAVIHNAAARLFRRHVSRRPQDHSTLRRGGAQRRRFGVGSDPALHLGQSEVENLGVAA